MTTLNVIPDAIYFTKKILRMLESEEVNLSYVSSNVQRLSQIIKIEQTYDNFRNYIKEYGSEEEYENDTNPDKLKNCQRAYLVTYKNDAGRHILKSISCKNGVDVSEEDYWKMVLDIENKIESRTENV